jgi:general L-amino acid transport system permease protein
VAADPKQVSADVSVPPSKPAFWNDPAWRAIFFQVLVLVGVVVFAAFLVRNTLHNMESRGISSGFDFLSKTAGFSIGETHFGISYTEENSYGKTFIVGLMNTIWVSMWGVFLATILGFIIGVMRLSTNWLVSKLAMIYIETLRNIPLLLQIFFWYFAILRPLPGPRGSIQLSFPVINFTHLIITLVVSAAAIFLMWWIGVKKRYDTDQKAMPLWMLVIASVVTVLIIGNVVSLVTGSGLVAQWNESFFLNNRGLSYPQPIPEEGFAITGWAIAIGVVAAFFVRRWAKKRQDETGEQFPVFLASLGLIIGLPLIVFIFSGFPLHFDYPELTGFNFTGGSVLTPEFISLLLALSFYTASFIAEIVRAGINAVSHGQTEAARAVGLRANPILRLVIIPQALRVIIPPLTSQYLNLTKNSSLAAAIAYPDIVLVFAGTTLMQTGQAVEIIAMTMAVYLTLSLLISTFMNWYNEKMALVER